MSDVHNLMMTETADRGVDWIKDALACAIKLEHSTIPPYLCAMWSIKVKAHPIRQILMGIVLEEMGHFALASNMLVALGGTPPIGDPGFVPSYPGPLPCGIAPTKKPDLIVNLVGFSVPLVNDVFLNIEYPENDPIIITAAAARAMVSPIYHSIGQFYNAIRSAFLALDPAATFPTDKQLTFTFRGNPNNLVFPVANAQDALRAIDQIREQGEGTAQSPDAEMFGMELAHYYKFEQITKGYMYVPVGGGRWKIGPAITPLTAAQIWPMAEAPAGGYAGPGVPPEIDQFNAGYKAMLANLKLVWEQGGTQGLATLNQAIGQMSDLEPLALAAMKVPIGAGPQHYGPTFRI
jgi:hypothetical protein